MATGMHSAVGTWLDPAIFDRLPKTAKTKTPRPVCKHCTRPVHSRGMCVAHYDKWAAHGDALWERPRKPALCSQGDGRPVAALGLCHRCYWHIRPGHGKRDEKLIAAAEAARMYKRG